MARPTIADLMAEIEALKATIASSPAKPVKASTFRTKAQREAGEGWPCTVTPPCSRKDLRTQEAGASHNTKAAHYHVAR